MKTIQKLSLGLLSVVAISSLSASVLELNTAAGDAEMAGGIIGAAKKSGANVLTLSANNSTSLTALEIDAGSVAFAASSNLGGPVTFAGGTLAPGAAVTVIPDLVMTNAASINLPELNANPVHFGAISGSSHLSLVATGTEANLSASFPAVSIAGTAYLGACSTIGALSAVNAHLDASSVLPARACAFSGVLTLDNAGFSAASSAVTATEVDASVNIAAAKFSSLAARKIVFGSGVVFSQTATSF